ncbi:MAG: S8 family serine peptidase [Polyangiaceae bacterium]
MDVESLSRSELCALSRDPSVLAVAPIVPVRLAQPAEIGAVDSALPWGREVVGAGATSFTGRGVTLAMLDSGIDAAHEVFSGVDLVERDFTGGGNRDDHGHGTHAAAIAIGRRVGDTQIGVAPGIERLLAAKVVDANGRGTTDGFLRGLLWALEGHARIVFFAVELDIETFIGELDLPGAAALRAGLEAYRANLYMLDALTSLARDNALFVAGAGNDSQREVDGRFEVSATLPACAGGVIAVGALERHRGLLRAAAFSNSLPQIAAPGADILSARAGGGLVGMSGTGTAAAHVAGVAALWWEALRETAHPKLTSAVLNKLLSAATSDSLFPGDDVAERGLGLIRAPINGA